MLAQNEVGREISRGPACAQRRRVGTAVVEQRAQCKALISGISHGSIVGQRPASRRGGRYVRRIMVGTPTIARAGASARPRRELATLLVLGGAGAGLALLALRQEWARVATVAPRPLPATV